MASNCNLKKRWHLAPLMPADFLATDFLESTLLRQLFFNRGLKSSEAVRSFLSLNLPAEQVLDIVSDSDLLFYDPFLFKDMAVAVALIIKHLKAHNKIVIFGDYDADGVTAAAVLFETLKILHAEVSVYLPDRVSEGYGLNCSALEQLSKQGTNLIISVDSGIRNRKEVLVAQSLGLDVIITDHHVLPEEESDLPPCPIINPSNKNDHYPWPYLAGVGVAFKLASALIFKAELSQIQKKLILEKTLDLVAVGTVADMVSLLGENRLLVKRGLNILNQGKRLGLAALVKISQSRSNYQKPLEAWNIGWQLAPRLNAASRLAHANSAFCLLTATEETAARRFALELNERNQERQQITEMIVAQVEKQINPSNLPAIIIGIAPEGENWNEGVVGLVAGRICERYYRPTLIISRLNDEAGNLSFKGSGRSIKELNLVAALTNQAEFLDKFGGHPMACGFSIASEAKLQKFISNLTAAVSELLAGQELLPQLKIEAELPWGDLSLNLAEEIKKLEPFGQDNPQPKLVSYNLTITDLLFLGQDNQHLKLRLSSDDKPHYFWALAFNAAETYPDLSIGDKVDVVYTLEVNEFNGRREAQLKIIDLRLSEKK
ncbi:single-stranded-DNA-specific exonuclease RecJ [Candidatus Falkowbacteria bacterium]|nr:single-stranded-DNA-specific exonuclease RecJ [Patescibacteria group bacterium]MDD3435013.1 single-stranded-DNA-specific exonuclease RecJ [Patescibacteria group bacterium]NCU42884.1 single-stranded-DNA-specific exonuclease RecJ [Candidatus Falkowbacteria bacterium]